MTLFVTLVLIGICIFLISLIIRDPQDSLDDYGDEEFVVFFKALTKRLNCDIFTITEAVDFSYTMNVSDDFVNDALNSRWVTPIGDDSYRYENR